MKKGKNRLTAAFDIKAAVTANKGGEKKNRVSEHPAVPATQGLAPPPAPYIADRSAVFRGTMDFVNSADRFGEPLGLAKMVSAYGAEYCMISGHGTAPRPLGSWTASRGSVRWCGRTRLSSISVLVD